MIKLMIAVKRAPGLSPAEFREHMKSVHAVLVRACPATEKYVRKYVQSYTLATEGSDQEPPFDGAAELWFDSKDDMTSFFADPNYLADVRPDESRFADMERTVFFVTEELQIV